MRECPELLDHVPANVLKPVSVANPWNEGNITAILDSIIKQEGVRLCFFIDGLDEFGDGSHAANNRLIDVVQSVVLSQEHPATLKCCVSSRPLGPFVNAFGHLPTLTMQAMNQRDISVYIDKELGPETPAIFKGMVQRKACGVFLWVTLAVQSLKSGVRSGDTSQQLYKRLDELPADLHGLFNHMLGKVDEVHHSEVALYFRIAGAGEWNYSTLSVCEIVFAVNDSYLEHLTMPWNEERALRLRNECERLRKRILICSAGLLDFSHSSRLEDVFRRADDGGVEPATESHRAVRNHLLGAGIGLIHRSVLEYLKEHSWEPFKKCSLSDALWMYVKSYAIFLTMGAKFGFLSKHDMNIRSGLHSVLANALEAEMTSDQTNCKILDKLNEGAEILWGSQWTLEHDKDSESEGHHAKTYLSLCAEHLLGHYVREKLAELAALAPASLGQQASTEALRAVTCHGLHERLIRPVGITDYRDIPVSEPQRRTIEALMHAGADVTALEPTKNSEGIWCSWDGFVGIIAYHVLGLDHKPFLNPNRGPPPAVKPNMLTVGRENMIALLPLFLKQDVDVTSVHRHKVLVSGRVEPILADRPEGNDGYLAFLLEVKFPA